MTDKIAETVARFDLEQPDSHMSSATMKREDGYGEWVRFTDYEALARDLAAARDRAEKAEAERDQFCVNWGNQCRHAGTLMDKLEAAEADRDRLAAELAQARTVQAAAGVLLDHAMKTCGAEEPGWQPVFEAMEPHGFNDKWDNAQVLIAALRALAKGDTVCPRLIGFLQTCACRRPETF